MPPPLAQVLLVAFALVWFAAFAVAVVQSRRRRREHGEPREPPLIDPELTRFGTPFSPIRAEAARLVREGLAADDPATAYVTRRLAERELPLRENPWAARGYALIALLVCHWATQSYYNWQNPSAAWTVVFLAPLFAGFLALTDRLSPETALATAAALFLAALVLPVYRIHVLRRSAWAIELNRDLAEGAEPTSPT